MPKNRLMNLLMTVSYVAFVACVASGMFTAVTMTA
jgi:hypothetical protein